MIAGGLTLNPAAVHIPTYDASGAVSFNTNVNIEACAALQRYLPSNEFDSLSEDSDLLIDAFSCDQFRMFEFKIRRCARGRSHDWTECPFAHPGEKARRRDPRKFHYSGTACPEFRKGACLKGESCEFAHGVFECWLHPARYRTQPCKDGQNCRRRICFFAHTSEQLRVLPNQSPRNYGSGESDYGSPSRHSFDMYLSNGSFVSSPTSILTSPTTISPPSESPPMSPNSPQLVRGPFNSMSELIDSVRKVHLGTGFVSPRGSILRPGFYSPSRTTTLPGLSKFDLWDHNNNTCEEEEPVMERVESGKDIRAKLYAKLSKENSLGRVDSYNSAELWVSDLVN